MSHQIDPLILQKLQAFSQRRRKLILFRGGCAALATLLATMMFIAFIDWLFVLSDGVRWALSAAAYLTIIVVEWRSCLRLLVSAPGPRRLARLVEHAEPKLREDLLSAVELGDAQSDATFDSEQFRALLQSDVATRMEKMDVEQLLPVQLLRRYIGLAIAIGVACIVAFALTGFQFGTLMMRALLPMANFARVSKVHVKIVEPMPAEMRVAMGDTLPLIVELSGQRANKAMLETFTKNGGREVLQMNPIGRDRFSATIQVGREDVLYRVRAGDGLTKKYQLEAVARPAVVQFEKTYTYPSYSKLDLKIVTEENGDLAALEGTLVKLRLLTNQKVREAELRIEQGKKNTVVKLASEGDALTADVPLTASGIYRVHLVGAESGFENKFSPEYELRAEPDLVPQVELELPKQDLILPSNEIVDVQGTASDDLALAKVSQLVKINEGAWKETPLATDAGAKIKVERRWDLFEQGVKPGDLLTMKLVATDLKGNRAESRPLQVTITSAGFESKRLQGLVSQRQLYEVLKDQQASAAALAKLANEARKQFERMPGNDPQRGQTLLPMAAARDDVSEKNVAAMKQFHETLKDTVAGHQTGELGLIGYTLIRMQTGLTENLRRTLEAATTNSTMPVARDVMHEATDGANRTEQRARQALESQRVFLTAEEVDVFSENLRVVIEEHERLVTLAHRSGTDAAKWGAVANRLRVILAELRGLEELAGMVGEHGAQGVSDPMRNLQKTMNKRRTTLETALAAKPGAELLAPTLELSTALTETARIALEIRRGFRGRTLEKVRELLRETEPAYANFEQLRQEAERIFRNDRIPVEVGDSLMEGRWQAKLDGFKGRGDIEEWRPDADTFYVNDLRLTNRVLEGLHERNPAKPGSGFNKEIQDIDRNFRVLECGHEIALLVEGVHRLAIAERWEIYNPKAGTANPADWVWLGEQIRLLPEMLGRALNFEERRALAQAAQKILSETPQQTFAQTLSREMEERFVPARAPVSAKAQASAVADYLQRALDLFRQPMSEARKELTKLAPTLAETMTQLAKKSEELKEQVTNQAQQAHEKLPDEAKADARQALAEQQKLNEKIESLKDALRADANQQDILKHDGRERARDADDALAMIKEPPVRAEEDLDRAAKSDQSAVQEQALTQAAEQQQKLGDALKQMAEHYDALDKGKPEETRVALRKTEEQNGIKEQMDQQFAKADELAKMAEKSPEELLKQLEKALPQNPQMQQELSAISQNTLKSAADQLKQASGQENAVAQQLGQQAEREKSKDAPTNAAQAAKEAVKAAQAAQQAANTAKQQAQAAGNPQAEKQAEQAGNDAAKAAQAAQEAAQAAEKMAQSGQPPEAAQAAQQTAQKANEAAQAAQRAASEARQAQVSAQQAAEKAGPQQAGNQQAAQQSGQSAEQAAKAAQMAQTAAQMAQQAAAAMNNPPGQQPAANPQLAQSAQQQTPIAQAADQAANDISRAGRHEERLQNKVAGAQLQQLGDQVQQTAQQQVPEAQKALQQAQQAAQAQPAVNEANMGLQKARDQLTAATNPGEPQAASQSPGQQAAAAGQPQNRPASLAAQTKSPQAAQSAQSGQAPSSPSGQAPPAQPASPSPENALASMQLPAAFATPAGDTSAPASPQEQMWMARTLDALDSAMHTAAGQAGDEKSGEQAQASQQKSDAAQTSAAQSAGAKPAPQSSAMAQAKSAMSAAAQAAAAAARAARSEAAETPGQPGEPQTGGLQAASKTGAQTSGASGSRGALAEAKNKAGDWGKLPKQMAEQLTQGQREGIPGEYRNQVETYYRVIAEKSKKQ